MKKATVPANKAKAPVKKTSGVVSFLKTMVTMLEGEDTAAATDDLATEAEKDEVNAGDPFLLFELADGNEVMVDSEGFATLDGEQMPAGEHALADGNFIVIDDSGVLVVTQPEADGEEAAQAPTEMAKTKAKQRAAAFLKTQVSPQETEITKLKKRLAELEKQPSTGKAKAAVEATPKDMTFTEKMAAVIKSRQQRRTGKTDDKPKVPAKK